MPIHAEGVENRGIFDILADIGIDSAQGYHIAKPLPLDEFDTHPLEHHAAQSQDAGPRLNNRPLPPIYGMFSAFLRQIAMISKLRCLVLVCVLSVSSAGMGPALAQAPPPADRALVLGILPFQSAATLFKRFAPLREYLVEHSGRTLILATAPNYKRFIERTAKGEYDLVLTAPHFTLLAADSGHYEVFGTLIEPLAATFVVAHDSPLTSLDQLEGRLISTPPESAIITKLARQHVLDKGRGTPRYKHLASHNASLQAMLGGDSEVAVISVFVFQGALNRGLKVKALDYTRTIPAMGLLAREDLPTELRDAIASALFGMLDETNGKQIIKQIAYPGFKPAQREDFESLRPFLPAL